MQPNACKCTLVLIKRNINYKSKSFHIGKVLRFMTEICRKNLCYCFQVGKTVGFSCAFRIFSNKTSAIKKI